MRALILAAAFAAITVPALAQDQTPTPAQSAGRAAFMQACGDDMKTYCASAQTRDDRRACVQANMDKFSAGCKTYLANRQQGAQPQGGQTPAPGGGN